MPLMVVPVLRELVILSFMTTVKSEQLKQPCFLESTIQRAARVRSVPPIHISRWTVCRSDVGHGEHWVGCDLVWSSRALNCFSAVWNLRQGAGSDAAGVLSEQEKDS